jgi:hypothetical protein
VSAVDWFARNADRQDGPEENVGNRRGDETDRAADQRDVMLTIAGNH